MICVHLQALNNVKITEWVSKKGFPPMKNVSQVVPVSQNQAQFFPSDGTSSKLKPLRQQWPPTNKPWTVFTGLNPEKPPSPYCQILSPGTSSRGYCSLKRSPAWKITSPLDWGGEAPCWGAGEITHTYTPPTPPPAPPDTPRCRVPKKVRKPSVNWVACHRRTFCTFPDLPRGTFMGIQVRSGQRQTGVGAVRWSSSLLLYFLNFFTQVRTKVQEAKIQKN